MNRTVVFVIFLMFMVSAFADSELRVILLPEEISGSSSIGAVDVDGAGLVSLTAQRYGNQLVVHAEGPDGSVIGKAETVVGLTSTPIYVKTSEGLEKITIYWGSE